MNAAWIITVDHISEGKYSAVGRIGPQSATLDEKAIRAHPDRQRFKMYDDDRELYYEGLLIGGDGFEPLDDFGTPNAGCSYITYKDTDSGEWRIL